MKLAKKRFKSILIEVEQAASELRLLSSQLMLLDEVRCLADRVLRICRYLKGRASELHNVDFVEQMAADESLFELDEIVDVDLMSLLEERLASACAVGQEQRQLEDFLGQMLDKLEKSHAAMIENIQRLTAVLARVD